jgi:hypothetical protein
MSHKEENTKSAKKGTNSGEIFQSKRNIWNSRRKYNYKYITTVL